ncbi:MAG TPA: bifunctional phosphopantothenoylcysteine decarboxylase/phosphopantothenate--cysteine ligase CoaBC [Gemmatimonadota bacterium]
MSDAATPTSGGPGPRAVTLGVAGGIAAYRAADVLRELRRRGFRVRVILTANARRLVSPALFEALGNGPVGTSTFRARGLDGPYARYPHLFFARGISAFAVVPATFDVIGKLAAGLADDLLTTSVAATDAPVLLVPSMNARMLAQPVLRENLERLRARGVQVLEPDAGELACGDHGEGRLPAVERICEAIERACAADTSLAGRAVLVTAGPTREWIDPVRYVSNPSTGAMGYALADEALRRGARVTLVSGPTHLAAPARARVVRVTTHAEMRAATLEHAAGADVVVMTAAVGDYRPAELQSQKIKKEAAVRSLPLERTEDILHEVSVARADGQVLIGFALETENLEEHARAKLRVKGLDWIVANDPLEPGAGFGEGTNRVLVLGRDGQRIELPRLPKPELASRLWDLFTAGRPQPVGAA